MPKPKNPEKVRICIDAFTQHCCAERTTHLANSGWHCTWSQWRYSVFKTRPECRLSPGGTCTWVKIHHNILNTCWTEKIHTTHLWNLISRWSVPTHDLKCAPWNPRSQKLQWQHPGLRCHTQRTQSLLGSSLWETPQEQPNNQQREVWISSLFQHLWSSTDISSQKMASH